MDTFMAANTRKIVWIYSLFQAVFIASNFICEKINKFMNNIKSWISLNLLLKVTLLIRKGIAFPHMLADLQGLSHGTFT